MPKGVPGRPFIPASLNVSSSVVVSLLYFVPLLSVIEDAGARENLRHVAREYHRELVADRGMDVEAQVLEIIRERRATRPSHRIVIYVTA